MDMTILDRLVKAEGLQGGVIADYDRRLKARELSGKSLSLMTPQELTLHGRKLRDAGYLDESLIACRAAAAHLIIHRPASA